MASRAQALLPLALVRSPVKASNTQPAERGAFAGEGGELRFGVGVGLLRGEPAETEFPAPNVNNSRRPRRLEHFQQFRSRRREGVLPKCFIFGKQVGSW